MQNETQQPYYLQQHEITKSQLTNFSQLPHAAESLQMTMNLSSVSTSYKTIIQTTNITEK